ncbi:hypothetical protein B296_00011874 [Ensete ventricosum]|uniref:Uncharacterized protein n=1 Tax=Ensete ventricosum TaxID=4639 RepID=A0A427B083_ENSVE|nr:hypothetical protein B296_00011874 [Ensete ventricosum]
MPGPSWQPRCPVEWMPEYSISLSPPQVVPQEDHEAQLGAYAGQVLGLAGRVDCLIVYSTETGRDVLDMGLAKMCSTRTGRDIVSNGLAEMHSIMDWPRHIDVSFMSTDMKIKGTKEMFPGQAPHLGSSPSCDILATQPGTAKKAAVEAEHP